jgi:hypothetical protein
MARPCGRLFFLTVWIACVAGQPPTAKAQLLDEATLLVRRGDVILGREDFSVTRTNLSDGSVGFRLAVVASYPERRAAITLRPLVEFGADSLPRTVQLDVTNEGTQRILTEFGSRRITIRAISSDGESAREYPAVRRPLVADDSILSLYALPPGSGPGPVRLVAPRHRTQQDYRLANRGQETSTVVGQSLTMLHLVLTSGTDERHLWYDEEGRLMKVEIPTRDVTAERVERRR